MASRRHPAAPIVGRHVLLASGLGYPLTQAVIARLGRRGAVVAEGIAAGLLVRDLALVRMGAPARLRPLPRNLLRAEVGAAAAASGLGIVAIARPTRRIEPTPAGALEATRRLAMGLLFAIHTCRFWIYLQPGSGGTAPMSGG